MGVDTSKLRRIGDYDLIEEIAEGGMGTVYKGRHQESGQIVALKVVPANMANNETLLKRFENEFKAANRLDHPNIVRALEFGVLMGRPYLVMEFVEGESLGQRIERDGRMPETEAIGVIALAAQGLHHAHKNGMVHRDVKPDNIMVTPDGQVKLADLGLVKEVLNDVNLTRTGRGLGTPHFMAPEQFRNAKNADVRCDIYSLGATLYQMVTGELPFRSLGPLDAFMKKVNNELTPPRKIVPTLSERIEWAIQRAMSADSKMRPASCREFVEDLTGQSTHKAPTPVNDGAAGELWYLQYKDETGQKHMVKGNTTGIRRSLKEGLLGDASNVLISRTKSGDFELLKSHPEFRDLVVTAAPLPPTGGSNTAVAARTRETPVAAGSEGVQKPSSGKPPSAGSGLHEAPPPPTKSPSAPKVGIPHIRLETTDRGPDWTKLAIWIGIAVLVGVILTFLLENL
jgi:serine/threonine protein kinase